MTMRCCLRAGGGVAVLVGVPSKDDESIQDSSDEMRGTALKDPAEPFQHLERLKPVHNVQPFVDL
ncbi:hypothetical protein DY000_02028356 [Brassica cretica]|uniref:Uncharacterized protein n=1 Tax=Brassica cretica TaxID=69181 RepID=A0ABQ7DED5_BRACR|nr:hypothetical protein DY000_02028356 [Brassica cretica]